MSEIFEQIENHRLRTFVASTAAAILLASCASQETDARTPGPSPEVGVMQIAKDAPEEINMATLARTVQQEAGAKGGSELLDEGMTVLTMSVTEGDIVVDDVAAGVEVDDLSPLVQAVAANRHWITAAAKSGTLDRIHFSLQPDFRNEYSPDGVPEYRSNKNTKEQPLSEVIYPLPTEGIVSTEVLETMIRHEVMHSLVQRLDVSEKYGDEIFKGDDMSVDKERYAVLCGAVRSIGIGQASQHYAKGLSSLSNMAEHRPELSSAIYRVRQSLLEGTFNEHQPTNKRQAGEYWGTILQSCQVDNPWRAVVRELDNNGIAVKSGSLDDRKASSLLSGVIDGWATAIKKHSIYNVISESTYLKGESNNDVMGHPYDNANEMMASLMTVLTRYPDELRQRLKKLPENQRTVLHDLMKLVSSDILRAHPAAPELARDITSSVEAVITPN